VADRQKGIRANFNLFVLQNQYSFRMSRGPIFMILAAAVMIIKPALLSDLWFLLKS